MKPLYGLTDREPISESLQDVTDRVPKGKPCEVHVYRMMTVRNPVRFASDALDLLLESLDESYMPDGEYTKPTPSMLSAAQTFVEAVLKEYEVRACEMTGEVIKTIGTGEDQ